MAKRFQPMKEFGRSVKKPKLDISIRKVRPAADAAKPEIKSLPKCSPNNFWDDDDDDVILLATQVAEAIEADEQQGHSHNISESEVSFGEFGRAVTTSTQRPAMPPAVKGDMLSQILDDDDEFVLLAAVEKEDPGIFKKPTAPPVQRNVTKLTPAGGENSQQSKSISATGDPPDPILSQNTKHALSSSQSSARRQLASERQIKFLMERVEALKKENSRIAKDLSDTKSKMELKDGESSLLRDELRHLKQQVQTLKMEKICSTKAATTECKLEIAELSKKVEVKETELKLKNVEYSLLKMKLADETRRFEQSICNDSKMFGAENEHTEQPLQRLEPRKSCSRCLLRLQGLNLGTIEPVDSNDPNLSSQINGGIYEDVQERGTTRRQRSLFQLELKQIQTIVAQVQLFNRQHQQMSAEVENDFEERIIGSVCRVLSEFWSYVHSLEFPKNCRVHPYHNYDLSADKWFIEDTKGKTRSLCQADELYVEERLISLRRYISALAVVSDQLPGLTRALLVHKHGEYPLLQIVNDAIMKLGFAREICEHFGLLEAVASWLHSMLRQVYATKLRDDGCMDLLVGLLKQLVFARPSAWIFGELSFCVNLCTRLPQALDRFCTNSAASTFVTDRVRSIYRFSNQTCLLQVYAGLVEIAFPLYTRLHRKHFELLTVICTQHVHFAYFCFTRPPHFIQKLMPTYGEDEDDDADGGGDGDGDGDGDDNNDIEREQQNTAISSSSRAVRGDSETTLNVENNARNDNGSRCSSSLERNSCECYTKLSLSVVTLLYQLLRQWLLYEKQVCTSQVGHISRLSVQLLHIIFCDNYITSLFRDSEDTTKHYLHLLRKWWAENAELLGFSDIHLTFLQKLQSSYVMQSVEANLANIAADLAEWQRLTGDDVSRTETPSNAESANSTVRNLHLIQSAADNDQFFEGLKGYAFNFQ